MSGRATQLDSLTRLIQRMHAGDGAGKPTDRGVRDALIAHASDRLRRLVHKQLQQFPAVRRWEETGDVLQQVLLRLCRALEEVQPRDVREFFALSGALIRRELIDLKRHYYGRDGLGRNHQTKFRRASERSAAAREAVDDDPADNRAVDPADLAMALEVHERVEALPPELRETVDLLWYQGLTMDEAGEVLGISGKTVSRRWRDARLQIGRWLRG